MMKGLIDENAVVEYKGQEAGEKCKNTCKRCRIRAKSSVCENAETNDRKYKTK